MFLCARDRNTVTLLSINIIKYCIRYLSVVAEEINLNAASVLWLVCHDKKLSFFFFFYHNLSAQVAGMIFNWACIEWKLCVESDTDVPLLTLWIRADRCSSTEFLWGERTFQKSDQNQLLLSQTLHCKKSEVYSYASDSVRLYVGMIMLNR